MSATPGAPSRRENPEPREGEGKLPKWFGLFAAAVLAFGGYMLYSDVPKSDVGWSGDARSVQPALPEITGEAIFGNQCAACHQTTGLGIAGVFPPLAGSGWVTQDPETPVRILLRGINGEIEVEGQTYNGYMPSFAQLSDEEIAKVLSYIRGSWANEADPIEEALVSQLRGELEGQTGPWAGGDELAALREE